MVSIRCNSLDFIFFIFFEIEGFVCVPLTHSKLGYREDIFVTPFIITKSSSVNLSYYRKISNIRRTNSQNLYDSRLVLRLSLPNSLKPGVKLRMKMYISWSSTDRRCFSYIWVINNFIAYSGASYIRDLTVLSYFPYIVVCLRLLYHHIASFWSGDSCSALWFLMPWQCKEIGHP